MNIGTITDAAAIGDPDRVALIQRITTAYLRTALAVDAGSFAAARAEMAEMAEVTQGAVSVEPAAADAGAEHSRARAGDRHGLDAR